MSGDGVGGTLLVGLAAESGLTLRLKKAHSADLLNVGMAEVMRNKARVIDCVTVMTNIVEVVVA